MKLGYKIDFSTGVMNSIKQRVKKEILQSAESSPELRHEVARVFQMANRRIQNIESKGMLSPAVAALNKGDITGFTKFSMANDWETLKIEYAKAISFLRQPTSTASGTSQYNRHLQTVYDLTPDEFDLMSKSLNNRLTSLSDSDFVERYLMRYKDFTGELEQAATDISSQIESEAESIQRALEKEVDESAENASIEIESDEIGMRRIIDGFKKFGL
jgi:hypothetical protein